MRILQLHSDFIEYEPIEKEIPQAESIEKKKYRLDDILVLFTCVEKGDDESVGRNAIEEVKSFLGNLKANKILIYPFAHLSSDLAKPSEALKIVKEMESHAKELKIETYRAPFGWNKKLTVSVKGHPLAEQSRIFRSGQIKEEKGKEVVSQALKAEEKLVSNWYIMKENGNLIPVDKFDFSKHVNLEKFKNYEIAKSIKSIIHQQIPPHVILMKKLELVDNEPASDPGNLRYYPKGRLIKSLLEQFVTQKVIEYGGMEVETPIMYDFQHPALANYMNRFPARQYTVISDDREFFLRFSACFGQFLMVHDAQISYKHLPLKIYELTRYSFRREKSGELVGLKRLRAFTMPDVHAMCADIEQAMKEQLVRCKLSIDVLKECGIDKDDYEMAIRFTKDFYEKNKSHVKDLIKLIGKPVLAEMWNERFFYFILKWDFNFIDNLDKASALSTDQIDVENSEIYDINYVDEKGKKQHPMILHCSPSGAIERVIHSLLEKAYREQQKGKVPKFPLWLSPTQVRLIPVSDKYVKGCEKLLEEIEKNQIRVDIDDRRETVQKKIRDAELEWVPFIVVVGEKEMKSKELAVRIRELNKIKQMKLDQLMKEIKDEVKDKPFKPLSLPKLLTERPIFVG
jgi:threonyl-tRNA synthetase